MEATNRSTDQLLDQSRKIVICFDGVRRELSMPFSICASREGLEHLLRAIKKALDSGLTYGWVDVTELPKSGPSNTAPLDWKTDGSYYGD